MVPGRTIPQRRWSWDEHRHRNPQAALGGADVMSTTWTVTANSGYATDWRIACGTRPWRDPRTKRGPVTKPPLEFDWSDWKEAAESIPLTASRFISHCMSTFLNIVSWIVVVRCNLPGPCFRSVVWPGIRNSRGAIFAIPSWPRLITHEQWSPVAINSWKTS